MTKKFTPVAIALSVLLIVRILFQLIEGGYSANESRNNLPLIVTVAFTFIYGLALGGTLKKRKWGPALAVIIAGIDIGLSFFFLFNGNISGAGSLIADTILLMLGYKEYHHLSSDGSNEVNKQ